MKSDNSENCLYSKANIVKTDWRKLAKYCPPVSIAYLKQSLLRLEKGQSPTIPFPLYGKRDISNVRKWFEFLEKQNLPKWLIEYERTRLEKVGPQGGIPEWKDLREIFVQYQTQLHPVEYVDEDLVAMLQKKYSRLNCNISSYSSVLAHLIRTNKVETRANGWNRYELKKTDPDAQRIALALAQNGNWKAGNCYTFARYNKLKLRLFMPGPFSAMIAQAQFFMPYLENIQKDLLMYGADSPYVEWADKVGFEKCFAIMTEEVKHHLPNGVPSGHTIVYYNNDFEKMDTRTGTEQYEKFFIPMVQSAFHGQFADRIRETMLFTTQCPVICPEGTMVGDHGTASGTEPTNGGETNCNEYYSKRKDRILKRKCPFEFQILWSRHNGDDSTEGYLVPTNYVHEFESLLKESCLQACKETGFDIQATKFSISTEHGVYCQNIYFWDADKQEIVWMYPTVLALNSILYPEHQYKPSEWDKDYRDIDIVEKLDNCSRHYLFHDIVDYVRKGMKYPLLGKSETETSRILGKYAEYRKKQSLGERYNRQDYDISKSPTVNYIMQERS